MEARIMSFEWKTTLEGRSLLGTHAQPPLISPVSSKHSKTNHSVVAVIVVLMVLAVGAICCCCYQWEGQLRVQSQPSNTGHSDLVESIQVSSNSRQDSVATRCTDSPPLNPSFSVMMPGDDVPRFVAWTVPQGISVASTMAELAQHQLTPLNSNQHMEKITHDSGLWIPDRVPG